MISTSRIIIVMYRYPLVIEQSYRNLPMYWWFMKIYLWFTFKNWWIISVPKTFNHQMAPSLNVSWSGFLKIFTGMVFTMFVSHVFFWAHGPSNPWIVPWVPSPQDVLPPAEFDRYLQRPYCDGGRRWVLWSGTGAEKKIWAGNSVIF